MLMDTGTRNPTKAHAEGCGEQPDIPVPPKSWLALALGHAPRMTANVLRRWRRASICETALPDASRTDGTSSLLASEGRP